MMPKAIQKPPYDERAVAPKVFPTAISLLKRVISIKYGMKRKVTQGQKRLKTYHMPASN